MKVWIVLYNNVYIEYFGTKEWEEDTKYVKEKYNINLTFMNKNYFEIKIVDNKSKLFYENKEIIDLPKFVIFRTSAGILGSFLEVNDIKYINSVKSTQITSSKALTHVYLSKIGIKTPATILNYSSRIEDYNFNEIQKELGENFILKANSGYGGDNVYVIKSAEEFYKLLEDYNCNCIFQKNIVSSYGKDIRVTVIGKKHIKSFIRENKNDFRSNLHLGGTATLFECSEEMKNISIKIANYLNLGICGIDFLIGENGEYYVAEVNSAPVFQRNITSLTYSLLIDILVKENFFN